MQRVSVVGSSGSGKSTLAHRLAEIVGSPYVELDALFHQPGWIELPKTEFQEQVRSTVATDRWIVDGNYSAVREIVWRRADTVVFLDLPRVTVLSAVIARSARRILGRTELWNGNRETLAKLVRPSQSIVVWTWTQHGKYAERYLAAMDDPQWSHLTFIHLRSRREAARWLDQVSHDFPSASGQSDGSS